MPTPGSSHALVLAITTPPAEAAAKLKLYLDASKYAAIAVVHGNSKSAAKAFDLAKQRYATKRGVVWITDSELLNNITDMPAASKKLFRPVDGYLMTFISPQNKRIEEKLKRFKLNTLNIDECYLKTKTA
ncbi:hypothetical protein PDESU_04672 [Pontiella desulfatans]|uniref:Uncharacterized protein n=1 Tax=Pontiella desulfatans TaxID=2750659 RepID=A0A6C2U7K8_PONDE|nr:hypothetical protein [Pontiella desulfatans]VGO16082.1 hypothetical protein PDESU_04672 [Pontiella desulfatans]